MKRLTNILKEYREEKGWTQEHFASLLEISRVTYIHYEKGVRTPDLYVLRNISKVTGLSADYILGISETKNVAQSDIAKTTGLSEKSIEFLKTTKTQKNISNSILNSIIEEESELKANETLLNLLNSIVQYVLFDKDEIKIKGPGVSEKLSEGDSFTIVMGKKSLTFPSKESDAIVEYLLIQDVIKRLKIFKKKYIKSQT